MKLTAQNIVLENGIVKLTLLQPEHRAAMHHYAITEPDTWKYSLQNPGGSATEMDKYLQIAQEQCLNNTGYTFVILNAQTNKLIGSTRFYDISFVDKNASIGYTWLNLENRRNGVNRQCKWLLLNYAFDIWQMERIEFRADVNNTPSIAAMKAIGCKEEGIIRNHAALPNGLRRTSMILSILKAEWYSHTKALLQSQMR